MVKDCVVELDEILRSCGCVTEEDPIPEVELEISERTDSEFMLTSGYANVTNLIISRLLFAMAEDVVRINFRTGKNLTRILNSAKNRILPSAAFSTGYMLKFDRKSRILACQRL